MTHENEISVIVVDDQALVRGAISALISLERDLVVVGEGADGGEAIDLATRHKPDVCVIDIQMPGTDGIEATAAIRRVSEDTRVLVVTTFARPGYLRAALDAGAAGFVAKDAPARDLVDAVRRVHQGLRVVDPNLATKSLLEGTNPLTDREREVLRCAADGRSVATIAQTVHLSPGTVRNHLSSAIGKTRATNRAQAVVVAQDKGWI